MGWDWTFVGELTVGVFLGVFLAGYAVVRGPMETVLWRMLSHPSVRKMASAADKATAGVSGIIDRLFGKV